MAITVKGIMVDTDGHETKFEQQITSASDIGSIMRLVASVNGYKVNEYSHTEGIFVTATGENRGSYFVV